MSAENTETLTFVSLKLCFLGFVHHHNELFFSYLWSFVHKFTSSSTNPIVSWWGKNASTLFSYDIFKVVANKDFGHSRKWILTYQICNAVVLDHLFQFWSGCDVWPHPYFRKYIADWWVFFSFSWTWAVGGGGWALTASCEQEWRPVVSVILWDFSMLEVGVVGCFVRIGWN